MQVYTAAHITAVKTEKAFKCPQDELGVHRQENSPFSHKTLFLSRGSGSSMLLQDKTGPTATCMYGRFDACLC